jgi:hypothetical protein
MRNGPHPCAAVNSRLIAAILRLNAYPEPDVVNRVFAPYHPRPCQEHGMTKRRGEVGDDGVPTARG